MISNCFVGVKRKGGNIQKVDTFHQLRNIIVGFAFCLFPVIVSGQTEHRIQSPDGQIQLNVKMTDRVYYQVQRNNQLILEYSPLSMTLSNGIQLGKAPRVLKKSERFVDQTIKTVWGIRSEVVDLYNELTFQMKGDYSIVFRAYNDGVAYRFITKIKGDITIAEEEVIYRFAEDQPLLAHIVENFQTSFEELFQRKTIQSLDSALVSLPLVTNGSKYKVAIMESDLYDYPGMYLKRQSRIEQILVGIFPKVAKATVPGPRAHFKQVVVERENYVARTQGNRSFPWRVMIISEDDKELADNDLVFKLARPSKIDTGWIKPGKVAWDWWNDWNLQGVDFESGINNKTYEHYIDFASKNNIPYVILDRGWSDDFDLMIPKNGIDVPYLINYAKQRGVKLILWCVWHTLDRQLDQALDLFQEWNIAGIKVDFIDRDDQFAIDYYERIAEAAAKRKLLVDFHGCSKPTGLHRTYPNVINYEGVRGNEWNKFYEKGIGPDHAVDIVFSRMLVGPMDYTPGAMRNSIQGDFHTNYTNPMSQGTRAHELAKFVVYYAPLQMLCDAPTQYTKYPDILSFLADVPTTWDETKVLDAKVGETVSIARKKADDWYIGAMTNWQERKIEFTLDFLEEGSYEMTLFMDGVNANKNAEDYKVSKRTVTKSTKINLELKKGGGAVLVLKKNP